MKLQAAIIFTSLQNAKFTSDIRHVIYVHREFYDPVWAVYQCVGL